MIPPLPARMSNNLELLSHHDFRLIILDRLKLLLDNLPEQLPLKSTVDSAFSMFLDFSLDPDLLEKTGCEVSALSEMLKGVFGWKARTTGDGIVSIAERGPAISALHKVFLEFWSRHPENNVLRKWISDVLQGVEKVYDIYNVPVRNTEPMIIRCYLIVLISLRLAHLALKKGIGQSPPPLKYLE